MGLKQSIEKHGLTYGSLYDGQRSCLLGHVMRAEADVHDYDTVFEMYGTLGNTCALGEDCRCDYEPYWMFEKRLAPQVKLLADIIREQHGDDIPNWKSDVAVVYEFNDHFVRSNTTPDDDGYKTVVAIAEKYDAERPFIELGGE